MSKSTAHRLNETKAVNMPLLLRSLSWPLIQVPVQTQCENCVDTEVGPDIGIDPGVPSPVVDRLMVVRVNGQIDQLDSELCTRYGCSRSPTNSNCCCGPQRINCQQQQKKKKNQRNLFSRFLSFRPSSKKKKECEASSVAVAEANGRKTTGVTVDVNNARRAVIGGGGAVKGNSVDGEREKKMVTSSPTFQQLIMTRRLLCRHYYPEGGWGVIIVIVAVLVQTLSHGLNLSFGIMLLPTSRRFHTRWIHTSK